jgi:hypothetical protein
MLSWLPETAKKYNNTSSSPSLCIEEGAALFPALTTALSPTSTFGFSVETEEETALAHSFWSTNPSPIVASVTKTGMS